MPNWLDGKPWYSAEVGMDFQTWENGVFFTMTWGCGRGNLWVLERWTLGSELIV